MDEHAKHLLWGFAGLVVVWFILGGPQRELARQGVYLHPLAPLDSGTAYGGKYLTAPTQTKTNLVLPENAIDVKKIEEKVSMFISQTSQNNRDISYLSKNIFIDGRGGTSATDKNKEYVRLLASTKNTEKIFISDFVLKSGITGYFGSIPFGALIPLIGQVSQTEKISLSPGERAIITTGESPIGSSFKVNMCSGYLGQFQEYTPTLRLDCPTPSDEIKGTSLEKDSSCRNFLEIIPRCSVYTGIVPSDLSNNCKTFIAQNLTYNGCVAKHKEDKVFFGNEWRIFLGKSTELWKDKQEIIRLIDGQGNTVDAITY